MPGLIGQRLGPYEIIGLLGEGGMASVYRARQTLGGRVQREVAVKVIESKLARSPEFVMRFEREAQTIISFSHPHILKVFDYGQQDDILYLVMELLSGGSLADRIRKGALSLETTSRMLDQIGDALDYAHSKGIVHRDLKPQNVLLDEAGNAFLSDFGIIKLLNETSGLTQSGAAVGTPAYMAPEQWQGGAVDLRADIYSLGVMLFEMLTGRIPFQGDTPFRMMHMHIYERPPSVTSIRAGLPTGIDRVLDRALAKDSLGRYQSAGEFAADFKAALSTPASVIPIVDGADQTTTLPKTPIAQPQPNPQRTRRIGIGVTVLVVLIALLGILAVLGTIAGNGAVQNPTATVLIAMLPTTEPSSPASALAPTSASATLGSAAPTNPATATPAPLLASSPPTVTLVLATNSAAVLPPTATATAAPTLLPPTVPLVPASTTPLPPTETAAPTSLPPQATSTPVVVLPTETPTPTATLTLVPPTLTAPPATRTPPPPTETLAPSSTPISPTTTFTAVPPTLTLTNSPIPPTIAPTAIPTLPPIPTTMAPPAITATPLNTAIPTMTATHAPGETRTDAHGVAQVYVPAGCFRMGSEGNDKDELPVHQVCLTHPIWLDRFEVSNSSFDKFLIETAYAFGGTTPAGFDGPTQPRINVSWNEAEAYAEWRGCRLPTEAEWEWAARGPQSVTWPWGNSRDNSKANSAESNPARTVPVDNFPEGQSWVGARNLAGNVWEWINDWYDADYYRTSPPTDPQGPGKAQQFRILRGGSFRQDLLAARGSDRYWAPPTGRADFVGFRVACSLSGDAP